MSIRYVINKNCLQNINHKILCHILEYIYTGETQVEVERLEAFLAAAKELKLPNIVNFLTSIPEVCII